MNVHLEAMAIVPNTAKSNINGIHSASFQGRDKGLGSRTGMADRWHG